MTPERFRECLDILGLSQRGFAKMIDWPDGVIRGLARGVGVIPDDLAEWTEQEVVHAIAHPSPPYIKCNQQETSP